MQKIIPVFDHSGEPNVGRMPPWIRQQLGAGGHYGMTAQAVHGNDLHTVCEEARCPNRGECWSRGTATFMLLGDTCTRACGFCAVKTGRPTWSDPQEAERIAAAVERMGLDYVVLTSVNRDDLPDGGAEVFAACIERLRERRLELGVELLTPDFHRCQSAAIARVMQAVEACASGREVELVWGHNVETVPSLYRVVRKGSDYRRSLQLLERVSAEPGVEAKSAVMLGLGETREEVVAVLRDLRQAGTARIALGQYLRPTPHHLAVKEYVTPEQFDDYAAEARALGFTWIKAGPLVRSSYHAEETQA